MEETLQIRVHGEPFGRVLVYLPGLHGDWTLVGAFREAVKPRVSFIDMVYPRTVTWSLRDYARGVADGLRAQNCTGGWLLAESFGSQVAWAMLAEPDLGWEVQGVVFSGGFVRYRPRALALYGARVLDRISARAFQRPLRLYIRLAQRLRARYPGSRADADEFVRRRTDADKAAAAHRLRLIAEADWRAVAQQTRLPVFHLTGLVDPIVPWWPVHRWLRRHCPGFRGARVLARSDHNVLGCAPRQAANQVLTWMSAGSEGNATSG
jgi:pimeloyl-ACP methyl ester carboxylesterase